MIETGSQIKAARALLGWTRAELAKAAGLHRNAVGYWEAKSEITRRHHAGPQSGPRRIIEAFAQAGVAFIDEPGPGVCLVPGAQIPRSMRTPTREDRSAEVAATAASDCAQLTNATHNARACACPTWGHIHA